MTRKIYKRVISSSLGTILATTSVVAPTNILANEQDSATATPETSGNPAGSEAKDVPASSEAVGTGGTSGEETNTPTPSPAPTPAPEEKQEAEFKLVD